MTVRAGGIQGIMGNWIKCRCYCLDFILSVTRSDKVGSDTAVSLIRF